MKIKWLGHASFLITAENGTRIITDPYVAGSGLRYGEIKESADIVTVSHDHFDHNNVAAVGGNPEVVKGETVEKKGIKFTAVATYHDEEQGKQRGTNSIICFEVDGIRVCHLGDLGHPIGEGEVAALGRVDILLLPVGGFFTIDAKVASEVSSKLNPRVIIPMHFKTDRCDFPIAGVDDFLQGKERVRRLDSSEAEFKAETLPASTEIVVLKPAL